MSYKSRYTGQELDDAVGKASTALQEIPDEYVTKKFLEDNGYMDGVTLNVFLEEFGTALVEYINYSISDAITRTLNEEV